MKSFAKHVIVVILGWQVRRLRRRNKFITVGVVGSIGKTSSKFAIAQVLGAGKRVQWQQGNYNDLATVPLVFFGLQQPGLFNVIGWIRVVAQAEAVVRKPYPYDVVVVELGVDGPNQISQFKRYLTLDLAVLTAITPEHMQDFTDLDAVAKEELSVIQLSKQLLLNVDLVAHEYRSLVPEAVTYGVQDADYVAKDITFTATGVGFKVRSEGQTVVSVKHSSISMSQVYSLTVACAVAYMLGLSQDQIRYGLNKVRPVSGRLQLLEGILGSTIIDDTYNSSPEAAAAALETLYRIDAPQKIALLGNMNELGAFSEQAHTQLGQLCDASQIQELFTLGPDANEFLAAAAEARGCKVTRCTTPQQAGEYLAQVIKDKTLVLVKGSQDKVYTEEAIKPILANSSDQSKLVRQSPHWLKIKATNFKS